MLPNPFHRRIGSPMQPGALVSVKGRVQSQGGGDRVVLNLQTSQGDDVSTIVLHVSIRFDQEKIVLNTRAEGAWGTEQVEKNPFKQGEPIDLRVLAHPNKLEILCNRKPFAEFGNRLPLGSASWLFVGGAVDLHNVSVNSGGLAVPHVEAVYDYGPGARVSVIGEVKNDAERFHINLINSSGDTILHINPRFSDNCIVRNVKKSDSWGEEEREGGLPFARGQIFDVLITEDGDNYKIAANGEHFCTFAHRGGDKNIAKLEVGGDVAELHICDCYHT